MPDPVLLVEKKDGIATLTLNRPRALNALSIELRAELAAAIADVAEDPDVGVVILTGAGRAFSAGLDLKELGGETGAGASAGENIGSGVELVRALEQLEVPVIAAINGFAITGGFELALACDILIGSSEARFADTHARVGIMPGWGLSQKLSRLIGISRAKEISLTGNYVDAERAERWGLLNRVVAPEDLMPVCRALAADILSCEGDMVRSYKRVIDQGFATTYDEGRAIETRTNREDSRDVSPEDIAERRRAVQARGREQS